MWPLFPGNVRIWSRFLNHCSYDPYQISPDDDLMRVAGYWVKRLRTLHIHYTFNYTFTYICKPFAWCGKLLPLFYSCILIFSYLMPLFVPLFGLWLHVCYTDFITHLILHNIAHMLGEIVKASLLSVLKYTYRWIYTHKRMGNRISL